MWTAASSVSSCVLLSAMLPGMADLPLQLSPPNVSIPKSYEIDLLSYKSTPRSARPSSPRRHRVLPHTRDDLAFPATLPSSHD